MFCFQEATEHFCKSLAEPEANEGQPIVRKTMWNKRTLANSSPEPHIFVVRGTERGKTSTAVAVRDSHFRAIRRDQFILHDAGITEKKSKHSTGSCFARRSLDRRTSPGVNQTPPTSSGSPLHTCTTGEQRRQTQMELQPNTPNSLIRWDRAL